MSRPRAVGLCALALAGFAVAWGGGPAQADRRARRHAPPPAAAAAAPAHLQVVQIEYRLLLSRGVVKAGPLALQALDRGQDPHDLRLRAIGAAREIVAPQLTPGQRWNGVVKLEPGVYHVWCSLPEHAARGMRATLKVVR
jgi:hypothetical protein